MISRYQFRGGVWIDIEQPTEEELSAVCREFSISSQIEKEIVAPTPFPLVIAENGAALLVLHFPAHGGENGDSTNQEVDFVVGKGFVLTVRYELVTSVYHLKKLLETQKMTGGSAPITSEVLLEILFAHLYTSVRDHMNRVATELERLEKDMFDGRERRTIRDVSNVSREFLHIEAALANHEEPLDNFLKILGAGDSMNGAFAERAARILIERRQVARLIRTYRAVATELRETNIALLESRQNEIMKMLTLITVIVLPLELIAVTLEIKAPGTPEILVHDPNGFWIIIGLMLATVLVMTIFFARKRWLS